MSSIESKLAFFDADGTLYDGFSIYPLFNELADNDVVSRDENVDFQSVLDKYRTSQIDYSQFVGLTLEVSSGILEGLLESEVEEASAQFFSRADYPWFGFVKPTFARLSDLGYTSVLVTAEPQFVASGITRALGFTSNISSMFGTNGGIYNGKIERLLGGQAKADSIQLLFDGATNSFACGDSEGDITMLESVDNAYCIRPTSKLREHAKVKLWRIIDSPDDLFIEDI